MSEDEKSDFLSAVRDSLAGDEFLKLTLAKFRGHGDAASCCTVSRVSLKERVHLRFVTRAGTQETTQNLDVEAGMAQLAQLVGGDYLSATLFTTAEDLSLVYSRKRVPRLSRTNATLSEAPAIEHDRAKVYLVDQAALYLAHLGVTHRPSAGKPAVVKPSMYGKFRQICRFVEILDQLIAVSGIEAACNLSIVDIGSGKGYLTFALHDHLIRKGHQPTTVGLETNAGLVGQCASVAKACDMDGIAFEAVQAEAWTLRHDNAQIDILIALHACDTATDDAIYLGITAKARLIVCAPCCQHEIAPQLAAARSPIEGLLKYGLLKQRQADLVTDAARALLLEAHGYEVRIIEFVSTEHSAKNLMIAAVRSEKVNRQAAAEQYQRLAGFAGFGHHRLENLLRAPTREA